MELTYKGTFLRDWRGYSSRELTRALKDIIVLLENAESPDQIPRLKRLRARRSWHKIEIVTESGKIYWVLCVIRKNTVELVRVRSEVYFKKNL